MFVERDQGGSIKSTYRNLNPDVEREEVADDDAELLAFQAAQDALLSVPPTPVQRLAAVGLSVEDLKQLLGLE